MTDTAAADPHYDENGEQILTEGAPSDFNLPQFGYEDDTEPILLISAASGLVSSILSTSLVATQKDTGVLKTLAAAVLPLAVSVGGGFLARTYCVPVKDLGGSLDAPAMDESLIEEEEAAEAGDE